ncbi:vegetative cell wall protein gp1 isoform X1 [Salmo trutta]|uniref:vegetative cell wall protein gp1 isoform X1 n=1 Tax=Salmo trutta TaxID=8032 RepID=UPI0011302A02|nr:vegetative cell wall protein gp1-like isoform X1 [Salmo trutta]XP_029625866.1 vegetative cell wall protein gp1-like isoform X1 [Salmo trutta]XP_029625867.1 vegetative cell wall protein gp1-like isoform X1 [Salmo trutta]XP_029625868.1 vegetative cell wall protein gp1-like isoform X1 [Salmo trutta]XP_029625869.1 vegetative cell wall protein gp1-like isoform X1 [Salmo trutta]
MLQQILKDMYIDPDVLEALNEDQKKTLFLKMREEQVRRWTECEEKEADHRPKSKTGNSKKVSWLLGRDGDVAVMAIGEVDELKTSKLICTGPAERRGPPSLHSNTLHQTTSLKSNLVNRPASEPVRTRREDLPPKTQSGIQLNLKENSEEVRTLPPLQVAVSEQQPPAAVEKQAELQQDVEVDGPQENPVLLSYRPHPRAGPSNLRLGTTPSSIPKTITPSSVPSSTPSPVPTVTPSHVPKTITPVPTITPFSVPKTITPSAFPSIITLSPVTNSVIPSPVPSSSVIPSPVPSSSGIPSPVPSSSVIPSPVPSSSVIPSPVPSSSGIPSPVPSSSVIPSPDPSSSVIPSPVPSSSGIPSPVPSSSVIPSPVPSSSVIPSPVPSSSVIPSPVPSSSGIPSPVPSSSVIPSPVPSSSVILPLVPSSNAIRDALEKSTAKSHGSEKTVTLSPVPSPITLSPVPSPITLSNVPSSVKMSPVPSVSPSPVPSVSPSNVPSTTRSPVPSTTRSPVPSVSPSPVPSTTRSPVPSTTRSPVPSVSPFPVPSTTRSPVPSVSPFPVPSTTRSPVPSIYTPSPFHRTVTPSPVASSTAIREALKKSTAKTHAAEKTTVSPPSVTTRLHPHETPSSRDIRVMAASRRTMSEDVVSDGGGDTCTGRGRVAQLMKTFSVTCPTPSTQTPLPHGNKPSIPTKPSHLRLVASPSLR